MFRVSLSVPEASPHGECSFMLANQVASLVVPSAKGVIIETPHLKPSLTLRCIFKRPQGPSASIDLLLGTYFPDLSGTLDSRFELEPSASTPRPTKRPTFSKEIRSSTAENSPTKKPEVRLVISVYRVEQLSYLNTEVCSRCGALSKIVSSQQDEITQLKERLNMCLTITTQPSLQSQYRTLDENEIASELNGTLGSINSKWESLQALHKEVERLRTRLTSSSSSPSLTKLADFDLSTNTEYDDHDRQQWGWRTLREGSDAQSDIDSLRSMLNTIETEKESMYERMQAFLAEVKEKQARSEANHPSFEAERKELEAILEEYKEEVCRRDLEVERYQDIAELLHQEVEEYKAALESKGEESPQLQEIQQLLRASEENRVQQSQLFAERLSQFEEELTELHCANAKLIEDNTELTKANRALKLQLDAKNNQVLDLEAMRTEANSRIEELEGQLRNKEDGKLQEDLQRYLSLTDQLQQQLLHEMDSLKRRVQSQPVLPTPPPVAEIKPRVIVYEPIKGDDVDGNLAEYLNKKEPPVPVPFRREEPGVYFFGTRKVFIKIEQGRIIIRVGGGFMSIDEFIDIYTPIEMEKQGPPRELPTRERLITKLMSSIDQASDYVTCVGLQRKSVSPSRRSTRTPK